MVSLDRTRHQRIDNHYLWLLLWYHWNPYREDYKSNTYCHTLEAILSFPLWIEIAHSDLLEWGVKKLSDLVGELLPKFHLPSDLDRGSIVYPKFDTDKCIGCGRCTISCADGGHQALVFDTEARKPRFIGPKCVGCHLCRLVCPAGAISSSKRVEKR